MSGSDFYTLERAVERLYETGWVGKLQRDMLAREILELRAGAKPLDSFSQRAAHALADEVDVLIAWHVIDSRSPAADALVDFRSPPRSERSARIADLQREVADLRRQLERKAPA